MAMPPRTQLINYRPLIEPFHREINSATTNPILIPERRNQQQQNLFHSFSAPLTTGFLEHFYSLHLNSLPINNFVDKNDFASNNQGSRKFTRSQSDSSSLDMFADQLRPHFTSSYPIASVDLICSRLTNNKLFENSSQQKLTNQLIDEPLIEEEDDSDFLPLRAPPPLITTASTTKKALRNVRFADECGFRLSTVRVMTEPSDYPPKISPAVLRRIKLAAMQNETVDSNRQNVECKNSDDEDEEEDYDGIGEVKQNRRCTWKLAFKQPASEYLKFRESLDRLKVALENVMLRNDLGRMNGTIKVANIAYEKKVFVRISTDRWNTFRDRPAKYQCSPSKAFDTFRFDLDIPRNDKPDSRIEFCVCYIANNTEYWDSNDGRNFVLVPDEPLPLFIPSSQHFKDNKVYY